jgi:prevent-host-death family protein
MRIRSKLPSTICSRLRREELPVSVQRLARAKRTFELPFKFGSWIDGRPRRCISVVSEGDMGNWQAAAARNRFTDIIDAAVAGEPQFVQRRDGKEVVVVSREYFDSTKPNIKLYLLNAGYAGEGEDQFDAIMEDVRAGFPDFLKGPGAED